MLHKNHRVSILMHIPTQSLRSRLMLLPMHAKLDSLMNIAREPIKSFLNLFSYVICNRDGPYLDTGSIGGSFVVDDIVIIEKF